MTDVPPIWRSRSGLSEARRVAQEQLRPYAPDFGRALRLGRCPPSPDEALEIGRIAHRIGPAASAIEVGRAALRLGRGEVHVIVPMMLGQAIAAVSRDAGFRVDVVNSGGLRHPAMIIGRVDHRGGKS